MSIEAVLVVVHPGSLCGSADMHLGSWAPATRELIAAEITSWPGRVAVITGDLDDELKCAKYTGLRVSLTRADYCTHGSPYSDTLARAARRIAKRFRLKCGDEVTVTGAWNDEDGTGCVTAVGQTFEKLGVLVAISGNAPASDSEPEES